MVNVITLFLLNFCNFGIVTLTSRCATAVVGLQVTLTSLLFATGLGVGLGAAVATFANKEEARNTTTLIAVIFRGKCIGKV